MNAWLIQVIRSIVAPKGRKPQLKDSMFPFDKMTESFFRDFNNRERAKAMREAEEREKNRKTKGAANGGGILLTVGEVQMLAHMKRKEYEMWKKDYDAGLTPNSQGLFKGQTVKDD